MDPSGFHALAISQRALLDSCKEFIASLPADAELVAAHAPPGTSALDISEAGLATLRQELVHREKDRDQVASWVASAEHERPFLLQSAAARSRDK